MSKGKAFTSTFPLVVKGARIMAQLKKLIEKSNKSLVRIAWECKFKAKLLRDYAEGEKELPRLHKKRLARVLGVPPRKIVQTSKKECPYCEAWLDPRGIANHIRHRHPEQYDEWRGVDPEPDSEEEEEEGETQVIREPQREQVE